LSAPAAPSGSQQAEDRPVSWKLIAPNILHDQKPIWTFPGKVAKGEHWKPTLAVVGATAGLVALDPVDAPYFRRTTAFNQFNKAFSGTKMGVGTACVPLSFYAISLVRKDTYGQHTALLAGEAVADAEILTTVMKNVDRRLRPYNIPPYGDFDDTWFRAHGSLTSGRGSFPSGHSIAAFAVATVFADRYRDHHWAPWVAYGLAGLVGFSRVSLSAHFPSDVFAGAAFGYVISHYVVLRNH
jgi:membrane-associated PAP2 superfamily phosphatase